MAPTRTVYSGSSLRGLLKELSRTLVKKLGEVDIEKLFLTQTALGGKLQKSYRQEEGCTGWHVEGLRVDVDLYF